MEKRDKRRLAGGALLLGAAGAMQAAARLTDGFADWYARTVYRAIVGTLGRFYSIFPFSVAEIFLYLLIFGGIPYAWWGRKKPARTASRLVLLFGALAFLYTADCGINYYAAPFSQYAGLTAGQYSVEELTSLCEWLTEMVNETAAEAAAFPEGSSWQREAAEAMKKLGEQYPVLSGFYPLPKKVAVSRILSVQQLTGVYSPFTVEANFNGEAPDYNIPHVMCHELSHLKGFMREDEANFIGWLACIGSENGTFRYSGYLCGWVYAGNALARADGAAYARLQEKLCEKAREDLRENNAFWARFEGKAAEVSTKVNDTYLKANGRADGVQSYGRVTDLMLAYRAKLAGNADGFPSS